MSDYRKPAFALTSGSEDSAFTGGLLVDIVLQPGGNPISIYKTVEEGDIIIGGIEFKFNLVYETSGG